MASPRPENSASEHERQFIHDVGEVFSKTPVGLDGRIPSPPAAPPQPGARSQTPSEHLGFRTVLRNRQFRKLWAGQLLSQTVMNAANYGMITLAAKTSGSYLATGLAVVAFSLPALLVGAPAGALVDRWDRRKVLWISNVIRAVASFLFIVSLAINPKVLWPVYALTFVISMVGQFFGPAEGAAIPRLVHKNEIVNALALFNITFTVSQALGLIVLGPLVLLFSPQVTFPFMTVMPVQWLFLFVTVIYLVAAFLCYQLPRAQLAAASIDTSFMGAATLPGVTTARQIGRVISQQMDEVWKDVRQASKFIVKRPPLGVVVFQLSLAGLITAVIAMVAPNFVTEFFHLPQYSAAVVFVPAGVGLIAGAGFCPRIFKRFGYLKTVIAGLVGFAISVFGIVITRFVVAHVVTGAWWSHWWYIGIEILLTTLLGVSLDLVTVPAQAMMQILAPDAYKARVLAMQGLLLNGLTVPVILFFGWLADATHNLSQMLSVFGIFILAIGAGSVALWRRYASHIFADEVFTDPPVPVQ